MPATSPDRWVSAVTWIAVPDVTGPATRCSSISATRTVNRCELFNTHYQVIDVESEPVAWDPADYNVSFPWGLPARPFLVRGSDIVPGHAGARPVNQANPMTLEKYLSVEKA